MIINNKIIRLASLFLSIMMLALPVPSFADEEQGKYDTTVSIDKVHGSAGEVVNVPIKITAPKKEIAAYGIEINYDKEALKVVGIKPSYGSLDQACNDSQEGCFWANYDNSEGFLRGAWADTSAGDRPINQAMTLFTVQVEVKQTDFVGEKELTVNAEDPEALSFIDSKNQLLSVGIESGKFAIVKPSKEESTDSQVVKKPAKTNGTNGSLPKTGDDSYIDTILNVTIVLLLAILLAFWLYKKKRKAITNEN